MPLSHPTSSKSTRLWIVWGRLVWPQSLLPVVAGPGLWCWAARSCLPIFFV